MVLLLWNQIEKIVVLESLLFLCTLSLLLASAVSIDDYIIVKSVVIISHIPDVIDISLSLNKVETIFVEILNWQIFDYVLHSTKLEGGLA